MFMFSKKKSELLEHFFGTSVNKALGTTIEALKFRSSQSSELEYPAFLDAITEAPTLKIELYYHHFPGSYLLWLCSYMHG